MTDERVWRKLRQSDIAGIALMALAAALWWYDSANMWGAIVVLIFGAGLLVTGRVLSIKGGPGGVDIGGRDE